MMRRLFWTAIPALCLGASSVAAQDFSSAASDSLSSASSYAGTVAVNSHLNRDTRRSGPRTTRQQRIACASLPRLSAEHGRGHRKVVRLAGLFRQAGLAR